MQKYGTKLGWRFWTTFNISSHDLNYFVWVGFFFSLKDCTNEAKLSIYYIESNLLQLNDKFRWNY